MITVSCHHCGADVQRSQPTVDACCKSCSRIRKRDYNRRLRDQNRLLRQQLRPGDKSGQKPEVGT